MARRRRPHPDRHRPAGSGQAIADAVTALGLTTAAIRRIVLTHGHNDHAGSAAQVRQWHGAPVLAHRADAPIVRGEAGPPDPVLMEWERPLYQEFVPSVPDAVPCPVDVELEGGEVLPFGSGAHVLSLPATPTAASRSSCRDTGCCSPATPSPTSRAK